MPSSVWFAPVLTLSPTRDRQEVIPPAPEPIINEDGLGGRVRAWMRWPGIAPVQVHFAQLLAWVVSGVAHHPQLGERCSTWSTIIDWFIPTHQCQLRQAIASVL